MLGDRAACRLILSGTPVQNSAIDLYSQTASSTPACSAPISTLSATATARWAATAATRWWASSIWTNWCARNTPSPLRVTKAECLDLPAPDLRPPLCGAGTRRAAAVRPDRPGKLRRAGKRRPRHRLHRPDKAAAADAADRWLCPARRQPTAPSKPAAPSWTLWPTSWRNTSRRPGRSWWVFARFCPEIATICPAAGAARHPLWPHRRRGPHGPAGRHRRDVPAGPRRPRSLWPRSRRQAWASPCTRPARGVLQPGLQLRQLRPGPGPHPPHRAGAACHLHPSAGREHGGRAGADAREHKEDLARTIVDSWQDYFQGGNES